MSVRAYFSLGYGRIVAGFHDSIWRPRVRRPSAPPVVYFHGSSSYLGSPREMNYPQTAQGARTLLQHLCEEGYTIVCVAMHQLWGNATTISRADAAIAYARNTLGCSSSPAILIGASQGAHTALRYAHERPSDSAAVIGLVGVVDLADVRDNDLWSLRAAIDAAWGVTYPAALPSGANPAVTHTASFVGKPIQWWYATDDPVARPTPITTFAAAVGSSFQAQSVGALGHTDAAILAVDEAAVLSFLQGAAA